MIKKTITAITTYLRQVRREVGKVVWPTQQQWRNTLAGVGVFTALLVAYVAFWDTAATFAADWLFN